MQSQIIQLFHLAARESPDTGDRSGAGQDAQQSLLIPLSKRVISPTRLPGGRAEDIQIILAFTGFALLAQDAILILIQVC